ncbi:MAG: hypothetical protein GY795_01435 [Desulfobacterales bacterium]|nr:hypothetical protein [Desulfobacterales bacterium]
MTPYSLTIFLSLLVAIAELFSKFKDEPLYILKKLPAWFYILMNISISCICLYILTQTTLFDTADQLEGIKASVTAGLGSVVLMRSKFLKVNVNGKETAIGPEFIINVCLETLERAIDRDRACIRKDLVEKCMADIDYEKALEYTITTMIASSQTTSPQTTKELMERAEDIEKITGDIEKSFALGYLVLDNMGEKFLSSLFQGKNRERFVRVKLET